jgi:hypothetical protein
MSDLAERLSAHFPPDAVSWRVGSTNKEKTSGMALAYIDARDIMGRFDDVCGPFGWQNEHVVAPDGKKVTCRIAVKSPETGEWVWKSDGAGETDVEGEKGSYSDSLKRAAVAWGVGRYLYGLASPWVELKPSGRSFAIADKELPKLRALLARNAGSPSHPPANTPKAHTGPQTDGEKPFPNEKSVRAVTDAHTGRFELLFPNGEILHKFDTPEAWCEGLRDAIKMPNAEILGLWETNLPLAESIAERFPNIKWDVKGNGYHPIGVIESLVRKLTPGMAA